MPTVQTLLLEGYKPGLRKVALSKLLRSELQIPLGDAKKITDQILDGKAVAIPGLDGERARHLLVAVSELGVNARLR